MNAIDEAFTLATAGTFTVGILCSLLAAGLVLFLRDAPAPVTESSPAMASGVSVADGREGHDAPRLVPADGPQIPAPVEAEDGIRSDGHH